MANFLYKQFIEQIDHQLFDRNHRPSESAPRAGIYRCMGCGREVAVGEGATLPGPGHHDHGSEDGTPRWRLIVYADHRPTRERGTPVAEPVSPPPSPQILHEASAELVDAGGMATMTGFAKAGAR